MSVAVFVNYTWTLNQCSYFVSSFRNSLCGLQGDTVPGLCSWVPPRRQACPSACVYRSGLTCFGGSSNMRCSKFIGVWWFLTTWLGLVFSFPCEGTTCGQRSACTTGIKWRPLVSPWWGWGIILKGQVRGRAIPAALTSHVGTQAHPFNPISTMKVPCAWF